MQLRLTWDACVIQAGLNLSIPLLLLSSAGIIPNIVVPFSDVVKAMQQRLVSFSAK